MLTDLVQAHYVTIYGVRDENPIDAVHFRLPDGYFAMAYVGGVPVAMGGWRRRDGKEAEIRRMFVRPGFQRRGLARQILAHLEESAFAQGFETFVLETGVVQPEAVALYRSSGYDDIPSFGYYAGEGSVHLGKNLVSHLGAGSRCVVGHESL